MKTHYLILCSLILCISKNNFAQTKCIHSTDSCIYFLPKLDTMTIKRLFNSTSLMQIDFENYQLLNLDSLLLNEFYFSNFWSSYYISEYNIQIFNFYDKTLKQYITHGFLSLKENQNEIDLCNKVKLQLGGGSSYIRFAFNWTEMNLVYFRKNGGLP